VLAERPASAVSVDNGLLEILQASSLTRKQSDGEGSFEPALRHYMVRAFSWAIPNQSALQALADIAGDRGVLEVGAGTGYWAALLRQLGVDVLATDIAPPRTDLGPEHNPWHPNVASFGEVVKMGAAEAAARADGRVLMLCWPPSTSEMGLEAVSAYQGPAVVYVGEWCRGTTGTPALHRLLERDWEMDLSVEIPVWWGRDDRVRVFRRRD
jgi:hypothetical protein